jgi:hypothetical protein
MRNRMSNAHLRFLLAILHYIHNPTNLTTWSKRSGSINALPPYF